MSFLAKLDLPL